MKHLAIRFPAMALIAALVALAPAAAFAKEGFYIGTGIGWAAPQDGGDLLPDIEPDPGIGLEFIHLGYNFNDNWGISAQLGLAFGQGGMIKAGDTTGDLGDLFMLMLGQTHEWSQWSQRYVNVCGRYTYNAGEFSPYFETGPGLYEYSVAEMSNLFFFMPVPSGENLDFEQTLGWRVALGAHLYISNWYLAPEISYHFVQYSNVTYENDDGKSADETIDTRADMLMLNIKLGYHWRGPGK